MHDRTAPSRSTPRAAVAVTTLVTLVAMVSALPALPVAAGMPGEARSSLRDMDAAGMMAAVAAAARDLLVGDQSAVAVRSTWVEPLIGLTSDDDAWCPREIIPPPHPTDRLTAHRLNLPPPAA